MNKDDAMVLLSLFQSLRYEIRATNQHLSPPERQQARKIADDFAKLILTRLENDTKR